MKNLLIQFIYETIMTENRNNFLTENTILCEGNKPPKWLKKAKKAMYKGRVVKVVEADGPGPMSIIKLRNGRGKTKQVLTKHLSKVKK